MYLSVRYQHLLESHMPGALCLSMQEDEEDNGNAHSFLSSSVS